MSRHLAVHSMAKVGESVYEKGDGGQKCRRYGEHLLRNSGFVSVAKIFLWKGKSDG